MSERQRYTERDAQSDGQVLADFLRCGFRRVEFLSEAASSCTFPELMSFAAQSQAIILSSIAVVIYAFLKVF